MCGGLSKGATPSCGGLGIHNLKWFGIALRTRWIWLQGTDPTRPWLAMPIKEDAATVAFFNVSVTLLFWQDAWLHGQGLQALAVPKWKRATLMVASALHDSAWTTNMISQGP
jgi:hypothetical protein